MMSTTVRDWHSAVRAVVRHGARARSLARYGAPLVNLLCPPTTGEALEDRAYHAEQAIRRAVAELDTPTDRAMAIVLCLSAGMSRASLTARYTEAGKLYDQGPGTFRRAENLGDLLWELTYALYPGPTAAAG